MQNPQQAVDTPRRKFLTGAAVATGAAALGFPRVAKAQGPISMRWQSTWPQKDIFHEYALDFASMAGSGDWPPSPRWSCSSTSGAWTASSSRSSRS